MDCNYIALDLETTGLNPKMDRILEIGAAKIEGGIVTDDFSVILNAGRILSYQIVKLTGITQEMTDQGEEPDQALERLLQFCGEAPILGHNIMFDFSFVKRWAVNRGFLFEKEGIDTLKIAKKFLPDLEKRSLEYLSGYYQIRHENKHRAYDDALAAAGIYERMKLEFLIEGENEELFRPVPLHFRVKKEGSITNPQRSYLKDLVKYHRIDLQVQIDTLTKSEASREIDHIISQYGRIR